MTSAHPQPDLPTGSVTLLFTDIEGSSRLWGQHGDAFIPVWQAHDALLRDAINRFGGYEVKSEGDSFMVAFSDAAEALNCALHAQGALARYPWPPDIGPIRVRMGLHTGEPFVHRNDYFGPCVNRAAETCNAAHGGQILVSQEAREAAGGRIDPNIDFLDFGEQRMKDLGAPQRLFQVCHPDLEARPFAPPRTLEGQPNNLPLQRTSFVGRAREIEQVAAYLAGGDKPVLTLTGPVGIGKTRLSLQVAAATAEWFPDGVWYVRLIEARDVVGAALEIASAMHIPLDPDHPALPQVRDWLADRRCLLILDDANTLPQADRLIRELLSNSANLRCLATSRESLQIDESDDISIGGLATIVEASGQPLQSMVSVAAEAIPLEEQSASAQEVQAAPPLEPLLPPLSRRLPAFMQTALNKAVAADTEAQQRFRDLVKTDAGRLFIERALTVNPDLNLSTKDLDAIEQLLRELDGAPVSIERAAHLMDRVPPTMILEWLNQRLAPDRVPVRNPGVEKFRRILRQSAQKVQDKVEELPKTMEARLGQFFQSVLDTTHERRDPQQATELRQDALRIARDAEDTLGMAHALRHLARARWQQGDRQSAVALLTSAAQLYRDHQSETYPEVQRELDEARDELGQAEGKVPVAPSVEGAVAMALEKHG
jgi:class 3 adenylate cyclase/tetratricopeptide (TPR) repeat protein